MMVAVAIMIGSFRATVVYWVGQTLQADLFIGPGIRPTVGAEQTLSADIVASVRARPDIEALDSFRNIDLNVYQDNLVVLGALAISAWSCHTDRCSSRNRQTDATRCGAQWAANRCWCPGLCSRYGTMPGDTISIDTPLGPHPFAVVAIYYDYAVDRGVIVMDRGTFARYFSEFSPSGLAAHLRRRRAQTRSGEILEQLDEGHRLFIYTNRDLRNEVLRVFGGTFTIHMRARDHCRDRSDARRRDHAADARRRAAPRALDVAADRCRAAPGATDGRHRGRAHRRDEPGDRPRRRPGAVAASGIRDQRAELRVDHSVSRACCFSRRSRSSWSWPRVSRDCIRQRTAAQLVVSQEE